MVEAEVVEALETFGGKIWLIQDTGIPADYRGDKMAAAKVEANPAAVGLIEIPILVRKVGQGEVKVEVEAAEEIDR